MYDLETLRYLNEQAHLIAVARANRDRSPPSPEKTKADIRPPPVFPLSILARKLLGGPPSLAYFIELLEQQDYILGFRDLVKEYLPEYEVNIMAEDLNDRALKFVEYFGEKFFPLRDVSDDFSIGDLLTGIPTQPIGFSYESYHSFTDFRKGYIIALAVIAQPWEDGLYGEFEEDDDEEKTQGARVPILEAVREMVGEWLVNLIPKEGWAADDLHKMTDDTEFEGLGDFADWVQSNTGLYHLDTYGEELEMGEQIEWNQGAVADLTSDWYDCSEIMDKIHRLALLLEKDSAISFKNLMALLLDRQDLIIPKEQMPMVLG